MATLIPRINSLHQSEFEGKKIKPEIAPCQLLAAGPRRELTTMLGIVQATGSIQSSSYGRPRGSGRMARSAHSYKASVRLYRHRLSGYRDKSGSWAVDGSIDEMGSGSSTRG